MGQLTEHRRATGRVLRALINRRRTGFNCLPYVFRGANLRGIGYPFFGEIFRTAAARPRLLSTEAV
jgi:hypothetical protein